MVARRGTQKVGKDALTGKFIPLKEARRRRSTAFVQTINRQAKTERQLAMSYLGLRKGVGYIGFLLPFVLPIGKILFQGPGLEGSMSAYFYTVTGGVFVGSLCAIGVFLISYRYKKWDIIASIIAGISAIMVALFPTTPAGTPTPTQQAIGTVHLMSAGLFFLTLALISILLFTKTNPGLMLKPEKPVDYLAMLVKTRIKPEFSLNPRKKLRNIIYRVCGWIILLCIAGMLIVGIKSIKEQIQQYNPVFWLESLAVFAFGTSWLVKGDTILKDRKSN
jgi:D-alanyl-lipoteichoic acid acyltransferase DltB (MBOAT superfamily)